MMHALVGEGEGEADAEGARAVDASTIFRYLQYDSAKWEPDKWEPS